MKIKFFKEKASFVFLIFLMPLLNTSLYSQSLVQNSNPTTNKSWTAKMEQAKAFFENKGQFDNPHATRIKYAMDGGHTLIYFSPSGLTYHFRKNEMKAKEEEEREEEIKSKKNLTPEEWMEFERRERTGKIETDYVQMNWENSNPEVEIVAEGLAEGYHSYSFYVGKEIKNLNHILGYQKLTYKNLYPNIDAEYVFHPQDGIKYSLILHPGADISLVKMKYTGSKKVSIDKQGKIHISTKFGDIIDHAPESFFANNKEKISSSFSLKNNMVSFVLNLPTSYSQPTTIIIDPWTQTPTIPTSNAVMECEKDGAGNVYILGGESPMQLIKYNSAGVYQWTHDTPYDTANFWLGTFATDLAGNSYVTAGSIARLEKVDAAANVIWTWAPGAFSSDEYWNIAFNCDQTKLIVGGTTGAPFPATDLQGAIFDINTSNGSVNGVKQVGIMFNSFPNTYINEARSISSSYNGRYYYLTLDTVGCIDQNFSTCSDDPIFAISSGYALSYKCENYRPQNGNGGIMSIRANKNFFYTQNGTNVQKRSLANGSVITTAPIAGGLSTAQFGRNQIGNSGIDIDSCGNVYVGSGNAVIKYDANLNVITSVATPFKVYDVAVSYNGDVIVAGATGDNSIATRTGYVKSINMSSCAPMTLFCCNANVCPAGPFCVSGSPVNLSPSTTGGTWSGPGVNSSGVFNPAIAGAGTHTIVYTLSCGSDSISITVNACQALTACKETNGNVTATSGVGPYTWFKWSTGGTTPITTQAECTACNASYTWFGGTCLNGFTPVPNCNSPAGWVQFSTGTTATPPSFPILVVDNNGDSLQIANLASLPNCSGCTPPSATATSVASSCGLSNGTASVNASGGTSPYTYLWSNSQTTQNISGLAAGTYTVTVTGGGCNVTASTTVAASTAVTATTSVTNTTCGQNNGSVTANPTGGTTPYTYQWSNSQTTKTISGLASGSYTVTITAGAGCTITATGTVNSSAGITATTTVNPSSCGGNNGSAMANPSGGNSPYTYLWSNSQTTQSATGLAAGNYNVTVTDASQCTATSTASISNTGGPTVTTSTVAASCGGSNGTATVTPAGGTTPYTFSWNTNPVQNNSTATGLSAGSFDVTVTDNAGCAATASVTVTSSTGPTATTTVVDVLCNGAGTGTATANPIGGTTPYSYSWSSNPVQTSQTATGLSAGNYSVTFTDANNCSGNATVSIAQPPAITSSNSSAPATCGLSDGSATVTPGGGNSPYTYQWAANATNQTTQTATGLAASSYNITITDANGCTFIATATVSNAGAPTVVATQTNPLCFGGTDGSATATPSGGVTPYSYQWGANANNQTTATSTGLAAGNYSVTVSDLPGCITISTVTIINPAAVPAQITSNDTIVCSGGAANLIAFGGANYNWSTGQTSSNITINNITSDTTIFVTVTDNNGCKGYDTLFIDAVKANINASSPDTLLCPGENTLLIATGGNTYLWSTTEINDSIIVYPAADSVFSVAGTTSTGCNGSDSVKIKVGPGVVAVVSHDTTIGYGATIQIVATGGDYYLWNTGETSSSITISPEVNTTFIVTVVDEYGCRDIDTVKITVECKHAISIPTIFSPNNDGVNDFIKVHGYGIAEMSFIIYDRWGEKVFEGTERNQEWDGTHNGRQLNSAVFVYTLKVKYCDDIEYSEKGNITLVR